MSIFDLLSLIGGLCLFLFGMSVMGNALERRAGSKLQGLLSKLTTGKLAGLLTGLGVTAIIQSSSATTVMVVGFVNSGLMTLKQAINVIMGANIGTTVTAWILSLSGIEGDALWLKLLKPASFTPVLALIGIVLFMFCKGDRKKDSGTILLGFAVLMFGMDTMSDAVGGLADVPEFQQIFLMFTNPILGVLAGAVVTAIIQSSSASVGILQALSATGQVSYGAAVPIIMGQNIGTCITAILSSFGTNRNAKRAAYVHLSFNIIGTVVWLGVFSLVKTVFAPAVLNQAAGLSGIATCHSIFNIACTVLLLPLSGLLEKLAYKLVPETTTPDVVAELDEHLMTIPAVALERCHDLASDMALDAMNAMKDAMDCLKEYSMTLVESVHEKESKTDHYEDIMSTYLVKLSAMQLSDHDSAEAAKLLKVIGDLERVADHADNILDSAEEMQNKNVTFSDSAIRELDNLIAATNEIVDISFAAFVGNNLQLAHKVEALEQVIDRLKDMMRTNHILRLQQGTCSIETGFIWSDILTNLERVSDHCSNIAGHMMDAAEETMNIHQSIRTMKAESPEYKEQYAEYAARYLA
ncbi:MAG: Na/Pi cotransporter family protein [Oscillospiraceae bacterium]|nr:Na/Pi cotransporter family protein [Oscillospiraceae bacterium]